MSVAIVYSRAQVGIEAPLVTIEMHLSGGLPSISIVGLPETEVKESRDRVRSAIMNSRLEFPIRRITINLAPADLPEEGRPLRSADHAQRACRIAKRSYAVAIYDFLILVQ